MPTEKKIDAVRELAERISRATMAVGAEYRGLTVAEMAALRRALREAGVEVHVVKNRLFQIAAEQAGRPQVGELAEGPTAVVLAFGDIVAPARAVTDYARTARNAFAPRKAWLEGAVLPGRELEAIASLPSKEVLLARLAGGLMAPAARLLGLLDAATKNPAGFVLNGVGSNLLGLLEARAKQLEAAA